MQFNKPNFIKRLETAISNFKDNLSTINIRVSSNILAPVKVECYGDFKPLPQVANVTASNNSLTVQAWDKGLNQAILKAIQASGLGLNPVADGGVIRVSIPPVTEERRKELVILAKKYLENSKIAMRNIRNDERDKIKEDQKNKHFSEDDVKRIEKELQKLFDDETVKLEKLFAEKSKEITNV